jgi:hypothetical protein
MKALTSRKDQYEMLATLTFEQLQKLDYAKLASQTSALKLKF